MSSKKDYIQFCKAQPDLPLFHQPAWWDITTDEWDVTKIALADCKAFLPYKLEKKLGRRLSKNPLLTPYSGPLFLDNYSNDQKQKLLAKAQSFLHNFDYAMYDCNPHFTAGLQSDQQKTTYILSLEETDEDIKRNFKSSLRRQLKKAEKILSIEEDNSVERFYEVYADSISRQKNANVTPKEMVAKTFAYCKKNNCGNIYLAVDTQKNVHSAIFYTEDKNSAYYLLGGSQKKFLGSGAMGFLLWHCIKTAKARNKKVFDFEGSEVPGVARFFSTFGGNRLHYPVLAGRTHPVLALAFWVKKLLP